MLAGGASPESELSCCAMTRDRVAFDPAFDRLRLTGLLGLVLIIVLGLWAQRHLLILFFGADDLIHLQQAAGLLPTAPTPYRLISQVVYFRAMLAAFGTDPLPYYAVGLGVHISNAILLRFGLLRLGASSVLAWTAAALFAACPAVTPMLGSAVNVNGSMALFFTLTAFLVAGPGSARAALSVVAFILALLSRESVVLLPVVPMLAGMGRQGAGRAVAWRLLPALGALGVVGLVTLRSAGLGPGEVYRLGTPSTFAANLATYSAWVTNLVDPLPDIITAPHRELIVAGLLAHLAVFGLPLVIGASRRIVFLALAWWFLALLPVLVLAQQTYLHYAYAALPGAAIGIAATAVWVLSRWSSRGAPWRGAVSVAMLLTLMASVSLRAEAMTRARLEARTPDRALPLDPVRRKAELARRAVASMRAVLLPSDRDVAIYGAPSASITYRVSDGAVVARKSTKGVDLLATVLGDGLALRLFFPEVRRIEMVDHWSTQDCDRALFMRGADVTILRLGSGPGALAEGISLVIRNRLYGEAVSLCDSALVCFPRDSTLRRLHVIALTGAHRFATARASLAGLPDSAALSGWIGRVEAARNDAAVPDP